jgi:hypothetical protein
MCEEGSKPLQPNRILEENSCGNPDYALKAEI